nr:hypothetical protein [Tanacetum cinerariifolium]
MSSNSDDIQAAGFDTRPPMLDRTDYDSWDTLGTTPKGGVLLRPERPRTYDDLNDNEEKRFDTDDNVKMLLARSELTKEDRESQLYDEFERFKMLPGENINEYYVRFLKLVNDMRNIRMTMPNIQINSNLKLRGEKAPIRPLRPRWENDPGKLFTAPDSLSEDFLEDLFPNQPSGNPTFLPHPELTSPEVNNDIFDSEGCNVLSEKLLDLDSTIDLYPPPHDNLLIESDAGNVYDDPFDSKGEKIKESKILIDELDRPCDFLPPSEYDSFISQDFSKVDALPSTNNEDKVFNPGILIQEKPIKIITVFQDKKLFDPPFYEPLFFKEVPKSKMLLPNSSENEKKVFKPGIHTSKKVHSHFIPELSHQGYKVFKINQIFKSLMKIFLFYCGKDTHILAFPHHHFYPLDQFKYGGIGSSSVT